MLTRTGGGPRVSLSSAPGLRNFISPLAASAHLRGNSFPREFRSPAGGECLIPSFSSPVRRHPLLSPLRSPVLPLSVPSRPPSFSDIIVAAFPSPGSFLRGFFTMAPKALPYSPAQKWWTPDTVAVVTGANKGIGYFIARGLAEAGLMTVVTSRDPALGQEAVGKLEKEGRKGVVYHQLDITQESSIQSFSKWLKDSYGGADILVNNAGFAYKGNVFGAEEARATIATNYKGTKAVTEALLPLLRPSPHAARIVNVSSRAGLLKIVSPQLQARFTDPSLTLAQLDELGEEFVGGIERGTYRKEGWPQSMYGVSKLLETTYSRVLGREMEKRPDGHKVLVNACCPGWCATDMSSHSGPKSAEDGADTPLFLALQPISEATSGALFAERAVHDF